MSTPTILRQTVAQRLGQFRKNREELIVEITIGNKGQKREMRIYDIHDMAGMEQEVRWFIQMHNLKEEAYDYIKGIIQKQIH